MPLLTEDLGQVPCGRMTALFLSLFINLITLMKFNPKTNNAKVLNINLCSIVSKALKKSLLHIYELNCCDHY